MNAINKVHDTLLYAALGVLIGLIYGLGIYADVGLLGVALCAVGGLILGAASGFVLEADAPEGEKE